MKKIFIVALVLLFGSLQVYAQKVNGSFDVNSNSDNATPILKSVPLRLRLKLAGIPDNDPDYL
jgi:uncharacterized membrane protein